MIVISSQGVASSLSAHLGTLYRSLPLQLRRRRSDALLDSLLETEKAMAIVLLQQRFSFGVRNLAQVLAGVLVRAKVLARLELPQSGKNTVPGVGSSKTKDPVTVACRVDESGHVQFGIVADVDEVLGRRPLQHRGLAVVDVENPVAGAVTLCANTVAEVGIG